MAIFKVKLTINQGETFRQSFTWQTQPVPTTPATPVDLTGYTARMQIRQNYGQPVIAELNTTNNGIVLGGTAGTVDLYISAVTTAAFTPGTALYDIEFTAPNGDVIRKIAGAITITPEVTI